MFEKIVTLTYLRSFFDRYYFLKWLVTWEFLPIPWRVKPTRIKWATFDREKDIHTDEANFVWYRGIRVVDLIRSSLKSDRSTLSWAENPLLLTFTMAIRILQLKKGDFSFLIESWNHRVVCGQDCNINLIWTYVRPEKVFIPSKYELYFFINELWKMHDIDLGKYFICFMSPLVDKSVIGAKIQTLTDSCYEVIAFDKFLKGNESKRISVNEFIKNNSNIFWS